MRGRLLIAATAVCAALATNAFAVEGLTSKPDQGASTFRQSYTETREPCKRYDALRIPFFGDLHVHTAFSQDASTQGTRTTPREAYRFARGEQIGIQPFDKEGRASRSLKLARALDFAVVTDHAEQLGGTRICQTPGLRGYDSMLCRTYRQWPRAAFFWMNFRTAGMETPERFGFCGDEGRDCLEAARGVWADIIEAAEGAYDRTSSCGFTTFIGYEWTGAPAGNNLHRNVIFRNDQHTELPISFIEAPAPETLWRDLRAQCIDLEGGCDALIIPHNSNLSGGLMFESVDSQRRPIDFAYAAERIAREPLVEVMQHKGDSECVASPLTEDERCDFEKLPYSNFRGKYVRGLRDAPPPQAFVREALKQGLVAESKLGINPFKVGMIGSTDTHLGAAGAVVEDAFLGHGGAGVPARDEIPSGLPDDLEFNPGGLAGIWAGRKLARRALRGDETARGVGHERPALRRALVRKLRFPDQPLQQRRVCARGIRARRADGRRPRAQQRESVSGTAARGLGAGRRRHGRRAGRPARSRADRQAGSIRAANCMKKPTTSPSVHRLRARRPPQ